MPTLNPALRDFWSARAKYRILYGGRASSKSWDAAGIAIFLSQMCSVRVLCARQFQNRIDESVYTLLKKRISEFGLLDQYDITDTRIKHIKTGSEFIFYGLWRNIEEIKSLEGINICWIEEGRFLTEEQLALIEPTVLRNAGAQIWIIFNPVLTSDYVWRHFIMKSQPDTIVRKINYDENPYLDASLRERIENMSASDPDSYAHIYLGHPHSSDEQSMIKRAWLVAAIDAHIKLGIEISSDATLGYDVADSGQDKNAYVIAHGSVATHAREWQGQVDDLLGSCAIAYDAARSSRAAIYYDGIGVGAAAGSKFKELNSASGGRVNYKAFIAGAKIVDADKDYYPGVRMRDQFSTIKDQAWSLVADRFRNTYNAIAHGQRFAAHQLISISSSIEHRERLIDELSMPKKQFDSAGRIHVQAKDELSYSPNLADAFIMAFNPLIPKHGNYGDLL